MNQMQRIFKKKNCSDRVRVEFLPFLPKKLNGVKFATFIFLLMKRNENTKQKKITFYLLRSTFHGFSCQRIFLFHFSHNQSRNDGCSTFAMYLALTNCVLCFTVLMLAKILEFVQLRVLIYIRHGPWNLCLVWFFLSFLLRTQTL